MQSRCVVAVYNSRNEAEQAFRAVVGSGVPEDHVKLSDQRQVETTDDGGGTFWDWLFGSDVPEDDRRLYSDRMASGGSVISVLVDAPSIANVDQVEDLLGRYSPVEMHDDAVDASNDGRTTTSSGLAVQQDRASRGTQDEQVVPLPEEELKIGKRAKERVHHVRTYVVEEPVQKDVKLRDERTVIERRPATGASQGKPGERDVEIREIHEEPVVQKDVHTGEELVVRKEATERTERVSDTVKKTKADIDKRKP